MRVADRTTARDYLKYLNKAKKNVANTSARIASGHRFESLSEDISSGTRVLRVRLDMYKAEKQKSNVDSINEELTTTESTLMSISELLSDIHGSKLVKAMSDTSGTAGRETIANEIANLRDQILSLCNTKYSQKYIFGGTNQSLTVPFSVDKTTNRLLYNGVNVDDIKHDDNGYYYEDGGGVRREIPMDGDEYFDVGLGITMTKDNTSGKVTVDSTSAFKVSWSGLDIMGYGKDAEGEANCFFNVLTDIENCLRNYDDTKIRSLDSRLVTMTNQFRANITDIGAKTTTLDNMSDRLETRVNQYKIRIDSLMGTNDAEETTNQTMNDYVLKAVLQMGANILPMTLMDFLR